MESTSPKAWKTLVEELTEAIGETSASVSFACGGTIPIQTATVTPPGMAKSTSPEVRICWHHGNAPDAAKLVLPLGDNPDSNSDVLAKLVGSCSPATFGRGREDVLDPSYRQAGKMDPEHFVTSFNLEDFSILEAIEKVLLPDVADEDLFQGRQIRAELYKLNVYSGPSGFFRSHVDTPRSEEQIGSLVVCLPAPFRGGDLIVRHSNKKVIFNWAPKSATSIQWAAFYSDCEHEIKPVTDGNRVTLTFNLYVAEEESDLLQNSVFSVKTLPVYGQIESLLADSEFMPEGGVLGCYCSHAYAHTSGNAWRYLPGALKGSDLIIHSIFQALGLEVDVLPVLDLEDNRYLAAEDLRGVSLVGDSLHSRGECFDVVEEYDHTLLDVIDSNWPHTRVPDIVWLAAPTHREEALGYMAYGNETIHCTVYSAAAILIEVPPLGDEVRRRWVVNSR